MLRNILLVVIILMVFGGGYGYYLWNKKTPQTASKDADLTLTANELCSQFDNAKHLGKIITVKGIVSSIETADSITNITLATEDPMVSVSCEMEKGTATASVKTGDEVQIKGQCDGKLSDVVMTRSIVLQQR